MYDKKKAGVVFPVIMVVAVFFYGCDTNCGI